MSSKGTGDFSRSLISTSSITSCPCRPTGTPSPCRPRDHRVVGDSLAHQAAQLGELRALELGLARSDVAVIGEMQPPSAARICPSRTGIQKGIYRATSSAADARERLRLDAPAFGRVVVLPPSAQDGATHSRERQAHLDREARVRPAAPLSRPNRRGTASGFSAWTSTMLTMEPWPSRGAMPPPAPEKRRAQVVPEVVPLARLIAERRIERRRCSSPSSRPNASPLGPRCAAGQ
jgi:hypothetical protein